MQIKTLLLGSTLATGAIVFSLHQIPEPVIPHPIHTQRPILQHPIAKVVPPHAVKVAHHKTAVPSTKLAKQKTKHKPYFLARAGNA